MALTDILFIAQWWMLLFILGIAVLPFTTLLFNSFVDRGYAFSKVLGFLILSYVVFVLGTLRAVSFTQFHIFLLLVCMVLLTYVYSFYLAREKYTLSSFISLLKQKWVLFWLEELLFLSCLLFWSYIRSFQPDIHGLEKYMDFGFINSILRTDYFPAKDIWFSPFSINYYYFGHVTTAVLTKLSGIPSYISFNLMIATIFALCFSGGFSIGMNLFSLKTKRDPMKDYMSFPSFLSGVITATLLTLGGNLHSIYMLFKPYQNENPIPFWQLQFSPQTFPNLYWYPNATRFIHNTIHEFPMYSFVVSDLHGHVLSIPIVLTILALLLQGFYSKKILSIGTHLFVFSFLIAVAYMTNAWDGIIYFLCLSLAIFYLNKHLKNNTKISLKHTLLNVFNGFEKSFFPLLVLFIGFLIFSLPFSFFFKPFVSGIGIVCAPDFLIQVGKLGPFLFEADHCQRSPLWQLLILHGFFFIWIMVFLVSHIFKKKKEITDQFVVLLIVVSILLITVPEFMYAKDIYPAHYRANTMFKLVYQAFIMLSICTAYIMVQTLTSIKLKNLRRNFKLKHFVPIILSCIGFIAFALVLFYPYFATTSFYGNLRTSHGLNGIKYLQMDYPKDYEALLWIHRNIQGQPIILEAQGDSYTDYARISANTGIPTVLGWTVHEWLWRGTYDIPAPRITDIQTLYESNDIDVTKKLLKKYKIQYIFLGALEKQKYLSLNEEKFQELGSIVYNKEGVRIYKIR